MPKKVPKAKYSSNKSMSTFKSAQKSAKKVLLLIKVPKKALLAVQVLYELGTLREVGRAIGSVCQVQELCCFLLVQT